MRGVKCGRDGGQTNQEERETEEDPWRGKDVNGRLVTEENIPDGGRGKEDTTEDVELQVGLPVLSRKESDLETRCTEHL